MTNLKTKTVLIADDDIKLLNYLKSILEIFFNKVHTAENGQEAYELYNKEDIDIIITDYVMPIMNGYELCNKIRKVNEEIILIIISNYSQKEKLLKSIPLQLNKYIIKPIDYDEFMLTLNEISDKFDKSIEFYQNYFYSYSLKTVFVNENSIQLTKKEILLLEYILKLKKDHLILFNDLEIVLSDGHKYITNHSIRNIVYRFNKKIGISLIKNIKALGYIKIV